MKNNIVKITISGYKKYFFWFCFIALFFFFIFLRMPYFSTPLNHDEVNAAYNVFQVMNGEGFYSTDWNNKPPLIHLLYAINALLFGELNVFSVRVFGLLYGMMTLAAFYALSKVLFKSRWLALFGMFLFAVFFSSTALQGEYNNTENFFALFVILAYFVCLKTSPRITWSYFLIGLSFLLKPTTALSLLPIVGYDFWHTARSIGKLTTLCRIGKRTFFFFIPLFAVVVFFSVHGVLSDFIDWVFLKNLIHIKAGQYQSFPGRALFENFPDIWENTFIFWIAGCVGFLALFLKRAPEYWLVVGWSIAAWLSVATGGWFFPHYFLEMAAPLILLALIGLRIFWDFLKKFPRSVAVFFILIFVMIFGMAYTNIRRTFFDWKRYIAYVSGDREIIIPPQHQMYYDAGKYLKERVRGNKNVFVWGGSSELYFWARAVAPVKDIWNYHYLNDDLQFPTLRGWFSDYEKARVKLMGYLETDPPRFSSPRL